MTSAPDIHDFGDKEFSFISQLVYQRVGIVLKEHKRQMVYSRLTRRLRALHLTSFEAYCRFLQSPQGAEEVGPLVNAITTNLTGFFREAHHFEHLQQEVLIPILQQQKTRKVRLWSAACSSGVEAYSMAMMVADVFGQKAGWDIKILATDIDTQMLATAQRAEYSEEMAAKIPARQRKKYTQTRSGGLVVMDEGITRYITFKPLNLMENFPFKGPFDAVFCRNVVIYFDKETQTQVFEKIAQVMPVGGALYIGHSENLFNVSKRFEPLGRTIYRRLDDRSAQ